ncbi:hypothetical protein E2C01_009991 [Portunus trituberculatus]|uniref:Uncharacterized protein n=1 Tax=Portunus trituberculatus TaxID=210409 RepID=A0A5B7D796_PORTR|nr:hypothetical protein [Portunus trituberculatus]
MQIRNWISFAGMSSSGSPARFRTTSTPMPSTSELEVRGLQGGLAKMGRRGAALGGRGADGACRAGRLGLARGRPRASPLPGPHHLPPSSPTRYAEHSNKFCSFYAAWC